MSCPPHGRLLGKGANGAVYEMNDDRVLKVVKLRNDSYFREFNTEVDITRSMSELGVGPRLYESYTCDSNRYGVMILQKLYAMDTKSTDESYDLIKAKLDRMHQAGVAHNDIKVDNLMQDKDGVAHIVDYGFAIPFDGPVPRPYQILDNRALQKAAGRRLKGREPTADQLMAAVLEHIPVHRLRYVGIQYFDDRVYDATRDFRDKLQRLLR